MATATAAVGFLTSYAAIGIVAPVTLILLRAGQGLAAGGELGVAGVLMLERAPRGRRGELANWHTATLDVAPGLYVSLIGCLALVALWRWPETAFRQAV